VVLNDVTIMPHETLVLPPQNAILSDEDDD